MWYWNAITTASTARRAKVRASAARRPRCTRSSSGPITGATTANGAAVIARYRATFVTLSARAAAKNSVLANATATAASTA